MKQLFYLIVLVCLLAAASFTVLKNSTVVAKEKAPECCQKNIGAETNKKSAAPLPYFPIVKML